MTYSYAPLKRTATRLLDKFGRTMSIRRTSLTGSDPWNPSATTADTDFRGVVSDYEAKDIDGVAVLMTDKRVLADPALSVAPTVGDKVVIDTLVYQVVNVTTHSPGPTTVLYELQIRR